MRTGKLGWTDERLPMIGQGTWMLEKGARVHAIEASRTGVASGMTLVDTAEMYGSGAVEEIVGEALAGLRDQVFLVSKVLPSNASYDGTRRACARSLRRLRTEKIDLYLLHWPGSYPIAETIRALESLIDEGQIRYMGVSNFDSHDLEPALRAARNHRLACNQVLYHLEDRGIERKLIPFCERHEIAVMGYSPFGHTSFPDGPVLREVAAEQKATPRQIALAFLTRNGVFAIPKSGSVQHVMENARAGDIELTPEQVARIDRAFPAPTHDTPLGML